jgi:hypothetical protein
MLLRKDGRKNKYNGREDKEEEVSSYQMTLKKQKLQEFERGALYHTFWRSHFGRGYGPTTRLACPVL